MCLIAMINQHIILIKLLVLVLLCVPKLKAELAELYLGTTYEKAKLAHVLRLEILIEMRDICDAPQEVGPANCRTLATYK
jgi:hypothetical protein